MLGAMAALFLQPCIWPREWQCVGQACGQHGQASARITCEGWRIRDIISAPDIRICGCPDFADIRNCTTLVVCYDSGPRGVSIGAKALDQCRPLSWLHGRELALESGTSVFEIK
eukprot:365227-Chlamydomonas_euryale.AAC.1